ncbi:MAG: hypothetical protein JKY94_07630 [Rhodobacteraceae bacterium]|nr:hypothetical protein [Paracoccaceae bacterium]
MIKSKADVSDVYPTQQHLLVLENSWFPTMNKTVLVALIFVDLILIALHIGAGAYFDKIPTLLNIAFDYSLGEFFGYAKWAAIIVLLWIVSRRTGNPALLACAALFAVMLADDSLRIHEQLGEVAVNAEVVGTASWANRQSLGEIAVWAALALLLFPVVLFGFVKSTRQQWVPALRFLGLICLFVVFGGVIDALHQPVANLPFGPQLADLVEDGGEMIVGSLIVAHAVALWHATPKAGGSQ